MKQVISDENNCVIYFVACGWKIKIQLFSIIDNFFLELNLIWRVAKIDWKKTAINKSHQTEPSYV